MINEPDGIDNAFPSDPSKLRRLLADERLAAATERSKTAMVSKEVDRLHADLAKVHRELSAMTARYTLAEAALAHIRELDVAGPLPPLPFLDVLLGLTHRPGSLSAPCRAVLVVEEAACGEGCCRTEVERLPCMLQRGHMLVSGKEKHRTLGGEEFENEGESGNRPRVHRFYRTEEGGGGHDGA